MSYVYDKTTVYNYVQVCLLRTYQSHQYLLFTSGADSSRARVQVLRAVFWTNSMTVLKNLPTNKLFKRYYSYNKLLRAAASESADA